MRVGSTKEYPQQGIDLAGLLMLNGVMKPMCVIVAVATLCSCHPPPRQPVTPADLPYTHGAQGEASTTARTIERPSAPIEAPATREEPVVDACVTMPPDVTGIVHELNGQLHDAFFDYDRSDMRPDALAALRQDADLLLPVLSRFTQIQVIIEGHCDERGSAEYNVGLGDQRARRALEVLRQFGLPVQRLEVISYGKEAPQCTEATESCWRRNRRAHLVVKP